MYLKNVPIKSVMSDHFRVRREGEIISLETCNVLCRPLEETKSEMFDMSNKVGILTTILLSVHLSFTPLKRDL